MTERKIWVTQTGRVIIPLPANIKEELENAGIVFESGTPAEIKRIGKKVVIEFKKKKETKNND